MHVNDLPAPGQGRAIETVETRQLVSATDDLRAAPWARAALEPQDARDGQWLGLALDEDRLGIAEEERIARESACRLADQHGSRRGSRLDALRGVHRIAGHGVREDISGQQARDDLTGVDADTDRDGDAVAPLERLVERPRGPLDLERRAYGADAVILVRNRRAEDGHDRVADVLVDRPPVVLDRAREDAEVRAEYRAQLARGELRAERLS